MPTRSWDPITPEYVSTRATEWERRDLPIVRRINRREQMYHLDWQVQKDVNREYLVSEAPQIMANRAIDKLCSQPPLLTILADADEAEIEDTQEQVLDTEMEATSPLKRSAQMTSEEQSWPRVSAEIKEALLSGLWQKVEEDQSVNLTRLIARQAVVTGYAVGRVINLMPDEVHEGEISTRVQILDRRFYHEAAGPGGGYPEEVLYTRRERAIVLKSEGWEVPINAEDHEYIRLSDYWRRIRVPKGAVVVDGEWTGEIDLAPDADDADEEWETQVWHAIVMDGGHEDEEDRDSKAKRKKAGYNAVDGDFAKEPTNMTEATDGVLTRIPYAMRRGRPSATNPTSSTAYAVGGANNVLSPYGVSYEGFEAHSFIEVYDSIWEAMNRIRSYRAHGVRMAVDPPSIAKTDSGRAVSLELRTPGAQNTLKKGEEVQPWALPNLPKEIAALDTDLRTEAQQATFSTANLGQGALSSSGVMTEKLQEAGAQSVKAFEELCEGFEQDIVNLLSMMARAYLTKKGRKMLRLPGARSAVKGDFTKLDGQEIVRVHLPSMSFLELMQAITAAKSIAEPGHDGWSIISRDTARELAGLPYPILEGQKVKRQRVEESDFMVEAARAKFFQQTSDQQLMAEEQAKQQQQAAQTNAAAAGAQANAAGAAAQGQGGIAGGPPLLQMGSNSAVRAHLNMSYKDLPPQDQAALLRGVGLPAGGSMTGTTQPQGGAPVGNQNRAMGTPMGSQPWMPANIGQTPTNHPNPVQAGTGLAPAITNPVAQPPSAPSGLMRFARPLVRRITPMFRRTQ